MSDVDSPVSVADSPVSDADSLVSDADSPVSDVESPVSDADRPVSDVDSPVSDVDIPLLQCSFKFQSSVCRRVQRIASLRLTSKCVNLFWSDGGGPAAPSMHVPQIQDLERGEHVRVYKEARVIPPSDQHKQKITHLFSVAPKINLLSHVML